MAILIRLLNENETIKTMFEMKSTDIILKIEIKIS